MILKLFFGSWGHSDALVADGFHSANDFVSNILTLTFIGLAYRHPDNTHNYGHGKYETLAAFIIGIILFCVAAGIAVDGVRSVISAIGGAELPHPDIWTVVVASAAIILKLIVSSHLKQVGRKTGSRAMMAASLHERSDGLSSIATLVGVGMAFFLGEKWRIMDPVASIIIGLVIAGSSIRIIWLAMSELLERSLPPDKVMLIDAAVSSVSGVRKLYSLRTRHVGHTTVVDVEIGVDRELSVAEGSDIAAQVRGRVREVAGKDTMITVTVEGA